MTSRSELIEQLLIVTRRAGASDQRHYEMQIDRVLNEYGDAPEPAPSAPPEQFTEDQEGEPGVE